MTSAIGDKAAERESGPDGAAELWRRYRWILGRLGFGVVTLFAVSILVFGATQLLPGDAAQAILGKTATPERLAAVREQLGLDLPPVTQYLRWLGGVLSGDLGASLVSGRPVVATMGPAVGNTLVLLALTAVIGFPLAILLGVLAAVRPGGVIDGVVNIFSIVISALPEFVVGILLVLLFAIGVLHVLPPVSITQTGGPPVSDPIVLVLPVMSLVIMVIPYVSRQVRASLFDVLGSEYIVMAQMKGLPHRVIMTRHALRNGLIPAIQATALTLAYLLGGTVIIEFLFQYPGMGYALSSAVEQRDVPTVQFLVLVIALGYVLFNLAADLLTVLVTPKLRTR